MGNMGFEDDMQQQHVAEAAAAGQGADAAASCGPVAAAAVAAFG